MSNKEYPHNKLKSHLEDLDLLGVVYNQYKNKVGNLEKQ